MIDRRFALALVVIVGLAGYLVGTMAPTPPLAAQQPAEQCFPETGKCVRGDFLAYWRANGGLRQQGLPISDEMQETQAPPPAGDGKTYTVQYFERSRFERHPENQPPNDVLLGLLGSEQYRAKYQTPPVQDPFTMADQGTKNTAVFTLAGGTYKVNWEATPVGPSGSCFHGARLVPESGSSGENLGSGTPAAGAPLTGETFIYKLRPGRYYIDATSSCRWSITLTNQR
jgi:hypothetical protein